MARVSILALFAIPIACMGACGENPDQIFSPAGGAAKGGANSAGAPAKGGSSGVSGSSNIAGTSGGEISSGAANTGGTPNAGVGGAVAGSAGHGASGDGGSLVQGGNGGSEAGHGGAAGAGQGGEVGAGGDGIGGVGGNGGVNSAGNAGMDGVSGSGGTGGSSAGTGGVSGNGGDAGMAGNGGSENTAGSAGTAGNGGTGGSSELTCESLNSSVVINEINTDKHGDFNEDYVEFANIDDEIIDLGGWYFSDSDPGHKYTFENTELEHFVVAYPDRDTEEGFGLGSDDRIVLYNAQGEKMAHCSWSAHLASASRCPKLHAEALEHFEIGTPSTPGAENECP